MVFLHTHCDLCLFNWFESYHRAVGQGFCVSARARRLPNGCGIYKVAKVFYGNCSDNPCNALPSMLLLEMC